MKTKKLLYSFKDCVGKENMLKTMVNNLCVLVIVNFLRSYFVKFIVRACCRNQIQLLMAFGYRFLNTFLRFFRVDSWFVCAFAFGPPSRHQCIHEFAVEHFYSN